MKKSIPIALRKVIEQESEDCNGLFTVNFDADSIVTFKDVDTSSGFYFSLKKIMVSQVGKITYAISYVPSHREHLNPVTTTLTIDAFKSHFHNWKAILKEMSSESLLFDDPITQSYYDELESDFETLDADVDFRPFRISQQLKIVAFLDEACEIISTRGIDSDISEAIKLIEYTKANISSSTKKQVIQNVRKIVARGFKIGLEVGQKLLVEFTAELAKKLILEAKM
jgi:hypothetical protein